MEDVSRVPYVSVPAEASTVEAFEDTYRRLRVPLRRLAYVLVDDADVAEEVVQDCFVRYYRHRRHVASPDGYLRVAVINVCRNHHRWVAVRRRFVPTEPAPHDDGDFVLDVVARLPHRQRAVVVLRFYEQLPEAEIATTLGIPLGTVKSTLHRALAELRRQIDEQ